jgi:CRP-like cAMP-binding protein
VRHFECLIVVVNTSQQTRSIDYSFTNLLLFAYLCFQSAIKCIQDTRLDAATLRSVAGFVEDKNYKAGDVIMTERLKTPASLYLIRQGRVKLVSRARNETLGALGYFGEETMLHDAQTGKNGPSDTIVIDAPYSVEVLEDCRLGVLTLENCRKVFDTIYMGKGEPGVADSIVDRQITLKELAKHRILGAGTFS